MSGNDPAGTGCVSVAVEKPNIFSFYKNTDINHLLRQHCYKNGRTMRVAIKYTNEMSVYTHSNCFITDVSRPDRKRVQYRRSVLLEGKVDLRLRLPVSVCDQYRYTCADKC